MEVAQQFANTQVRNGFVRKVRTMTCIDSPQQLLVQAVARAAQMFVSGPWTDNLLQRAGSHPLAR